MEGRIRVAVIQAQPAAELDVALERTRELALEAATQGARLIAFPETWIPGYPAWLDCCRDVALWDHSPVKQVFARMAANSIVVDGESGLRLRQIAREAGATLVVGAVERVEHGRGRGTLYNVLLTIGPDGALLNHHRKLVPTFTEKMVWGQGDADGLRAVDLDGVRVGGLVCWEHWMPLARQALHDTGEDVHIAVWPTVHERHQIASRHYAFEGRCFVLAAGALLRVSDLPPELELQQDRAPGDFILRGGSAIIGPDGCYIVEPVWERPQIIVADLELDRVREESMTLDVSGHYQRADLFRFDVSRGTRVSQSPEP